MAWLTLTRMVERKTKDGARGELRTFAFAGVSPLWVRADHVSAVHTFHGHVYTDDWETVERDITALRLVGGGEEIFVDEPVDEVLAALGITSGG